MQRSCRVEEILCRLPIFSPVNGRWSSLNTSNRTDFISAYISYLLNLKAYNYSVFDPRQNLARRVAAVDFDESWTHNAPTGQRYHFMKSSIESEYEAYLNGCIFIKERMDKWVVECQQKFLLLNNYKKKNNTHNNKIGTFMDRRYGVKHLAEALHCLQDSFSPAHTVRSFDVSEKNRNRSEAMARSAKIVNIVDPPPIVKIFDYSTQQHGSPIDTRTPHSVGDIHSGSLETNIAKLAIKATIELIILGLKAVSRRQRSLCGWNEYKNKWLWEKNLPKKVES